MEAFRNPLVEPYLGVSGEAKVFYAIGFCEGHCGAALVADDGKARGAAAGVDADVGHSRGNADDLQRAAVSESIRKSRCI